MEKIFITGLFIFLFSLHSSGKQDSPEKKVDKDCENSKIGSFESIRGSPIDTMENTIEIDGKLNSVKLNGKLAKMIKDTLGNEIYVDGSGNIILIEQKNHSSKVVVSQKGKNNQISIIQK